MFVKKSWSTKQKNPKPQYQIVESYRDPETNIPKHRAIMNITSLPEETIEAITLSLKGEKLTSLGNISISVGDAYRGAGTLCVYRLWKKQNMDKIVPFLSPAERESLFAMVLQRILEPGSKLALKEQLADSIISKIFSKKRLDEDELYDVMDKLYENFHEVQKRLLEANNDSNTLLLYDITSTYFEGTKAEDGKHGHSRDKRWDRYQIVIGLVCNGEGLPLTIEVWPGNTADKATVQEQVRMLKDRFGITDAIIIGDKGMYSKANIDCIVNNGFDYILSVDWQKQRKELLSLQDNQLSLLDDVGVIEWEEGNARYVGCFSEWRKKRQIRQRIEGIKDSKKALDRLKETASNGRYYSWVSLRKKVDNILSKHKVSRLWNIEIIPLEEGKKPEEKSPFDIRCTINGQAVKERKRLEGKFLLETSVKSQVKTAKEIKKTYAEQQKIERAFRNIKSYLEIRPVYHRKERRVKAHVLICFLSYYLVKRAEMEFRENGITREAVRVIRDWDKLKFTKVTLEAKGDVIEEWQWQMGEMGHRIQKEISALGWWKSIESYKRSLLARLD